MKKVFALVLAVLMTALLAECGGTQAKTKTNSASPKKNGNVLVVYFSNTRNTKAAAETIAKTTGGTLYAIIPQNPYTAADLDYNTADCRANREQNDPKARPAIKGSIPNWEKYDTVFVGYPIWWGKEPRIMDTFAEQYDFSGKTVVPFCTSGSSDIGSSGEDLAKLAGSGKWLPGKRLTAEVSTSEITSWLSELGLQ